MPKILKLGTRRSLLAWSQSSWVAREVERLSPGVRVELVGIETRGDRIVDSPLRAVEGKEFFVAEIDDALRSTRVDFTVHSLKDLSLDRPSDLICAAVPKRKNPRDVVLFGPMAMDRLRRGERLRIGTSSPRRRENIPPFLAQALPWFSSAGPVMEFVEIRGNVNTRLGHIHEPVSSERYLDGVVLAFAGLIRLWADTTGCMEVSSLLRGVRWMVLPLAQCPAAPGQGALAVECRRADSEVRSILLPLHHVESADYVRDERLLLSEWGGGCHQEFGATVVPHPELGKLFWIRGRKVGGEFVEELRWQQPLRDLTLDVSDVWDGSKWRLCSETVRASQRDIRMNLRKAAVFVAHSRAVSSEFARDLSDARIWTSGVPSWFRLSKQGIWVEGCAETMGFEFLRPVLGESVLGLPPIRDWSVLTHEDAARGWGMENVFSTYKVEQEWSESAKAALRRARYVFWSSGSQYDALKDDIAQGSVHACGAGKTPAYLRSKGLDVHVFPSAEEWRKWLKV